jgi:hypothetical protein
LRAILGCAADRRVRSESGIGYAPRAVDVNLRSTSDIANANRGGPARRRIRRCR